MPFNPLLNFRKAVTVPVGDHFLTAFPVTAAGASANTVKLPAKSVKGVMISGRADTDVGYTWAKPTLTFLNLGSGKNYVIWVLWQ